MFARTTGHRRRVLEFAGVAMYAFFLVTSPFEHHDLSCEMKTPQHCTACTSSQVGAGSNAPAVPGACQLVDAGCAVSLQVLVADALLAVRSTGRSPPARA